MRLNENTSVPVKFIGFLLFVVIPVTMWFMRLEAQARSATEAVATFKQHEDSLIFELRDINKRLSHIEGQLDSPVFVRAGKRDKK